MRVLARQPILAVARCADGLAELTDVGMVGHILHGQAACAAAATVGHPLDFNEVWFA